MDPKVAKKTQDTLGKVIKKPSLTEKLLSKPPFRFLHDIITEVIKNTGVLNGLYSEGELNSANVTDKDAKMNFLQKAIDCIGLIIGEPLSIRPSKIVAGQEPEKTNEFLQHLGKICLKKTDTASSVKKVLAGEKPSGKRKSAGSSSSSKTNDAVKDSKSKSSKDSEKESKTKHSSSEKKDTKEKEMKKETKEKEMKKEIKEKEMKKETKEKEMKKEIKEKETKKETKEKEMKKEKSRDDDNKEDDKERHVNAEMPEEAPKGLQRPASAKGQRRRPSHTEVEDATDQEKGVELLISKNKEGVANQMDSVKMSSTQRPSSARPAPPRVRKQQIVEERQPSASSRKAVGPVIVDNKKQEEDDDDDIFIVEEDPTLQEIQPSHSNTDFTNAEEHGSLVRKMLESKKEADARQGTKKNDDKPIIFDAARKKEREMAEKEIENLRNNIQLLVRSAHPLGKIMDYVLEDIDSMQKELHVWKEENRRHEQALKTEQSITESEIAPLQAHLADLEREIAEVTDSISVVKSNILRRNEEKIEKLVAGVSLHV